MLEQIKKGGPVTITTGVPVSWSLTSMGSTAEMNFACAPTWVSSCDTSLRSCCAARAWLSADRWSWLISPCLTTVVPISTPIPRARKIATIVTRCWRNEING